MSPKSKLGEPVDYALEPGPRLLVFLHHAEIALSENLADNSMLGVAVGRKNLSHIGSVVAGPRVAAILSVVETFRRDQIHFVAATTQLNSA